MCVGNEFQVDGAETENAREVKLLVMPVGLARKFVLEERKALGGRQWAIISDKYGGRAVWGVFQVSKQSLKLIRWITGSQ